MIFTKQNQATLMKVYNQARSAANAGKTFKGRKLEIGRTNRAFGILQSNGYERDYLTTLQGCNCPDSQYRKEYACKHLTAAMIEQRIYEQESAEAYQARQFEWLKVEAVQSWEQKSAEQHLKELGF